MTVVLDGASMTIGELVAIAERNEPVELAVPMGPAGTGLTVGLAAAAGTAEQGRDRPRANGHRLPGRGRIGRKDMG